MPEVQKKMPCPVTSHWRKTDQDTRTMAGLVKKQNVSSLKGRRNRDPGGKETDNTATMEKFGKSSEN